MNDYLDAFRPKRNEKGFDHYKEINPLLTLRMYNFLKGNGSLWKIECGKEVKIKYDTEHLLPVWYLDTPQCYCNRFKNYYHDENNNNEN
jgi:hypothetical protein